MQALQKIRGTKNGYCVRTTNILDEEYTKLKDNDLEQRKAALKAKLQTNK